MRPHRLPALAGQLAVTSLALISLSGAPQAAASTVSLVPLAIVAPHSPKDSAPDPACTTPAPAATFGEFHCYTPDQISAAYGVDALHNAVLRGHGQTIVLADSYGSPTAAHDIKFFPHTFFPNLPNPNFPHTYTPP